MKSDLPCSFIMTCGESKYVRAQRSLAPLAASKTLRKRRGSINLNFILYQEN